MWGLGGFGFRATLADIMQNQMEKNMDNEMETGGMYRLEELNSSYYIGEDRLITILKPIYP